MKCKICGSELIRSISAMEDFLLGINREKVKFDIFICQECGCGFTYPLMSNMELSEYYPAEYNPYHKSQGMRQILSVLSCKNDIWLIKKRLGRTGSLFEFGAGNGGFLSCAQNAGFDVTGNDMSENAVKSVFDIYGIKIMLSDAEQVCFDKKYDVVVLRHVLEHIDNFEIVIDNITNDGLKRGGILYVKVPRFDSMEYKLFGKYFRGLDVPRHRNQFTKKGIAQYLKEKGFKNIKVYGEENPIDYYTGYARLLTKSKSICKILCILSMPVFLILYFVSFIRPGRMTVVAIKK